MVAIIFPGNRVGIWRESGNGDVKKLSEGSECPRLARFWSAANPEEVCSNHGHHSRLRSSTFTGVELAVIVLAFTGCVGLAGLGKHCLCL